MTGHVTLEANLLGNSTLEAIVPQGHPLRAIDRVAEESFAKHEPHLDCRLLGGQIGLAECPILAAAMAFPLIRVSRPRAA